MSGLVGELGSSINAANATALQNMINLADVAAGKSITVNDIAIGTNTYTKNDAGKWIGADGREAVGKDLEALTKLEDMETGDAVSFVGGVIVAINNEVQAGGLVELQFRIDQMMAAVQEGIKNTGKVSQTREGAARA